MSLNGQDITLLDTPGFDDTERTDADVLTLIADFLGATHQNDTLLTGIILLQPVTGNRFQGSERRRLRLFKKICGPEAYSHTVIATTMWSELADTADGTSRVAQREQNWWGDMIAGGAQIVRHENTAESAKDIIAMLCQKDMVALQMQQELMRTGGKLSATSAGRQMSSDLKEQSRMFAAELEKLEEELRKKRQENADLQMEMEELRVKLERVVEEQEKLNNQWVGEITFLIQLFYS